MNKHSLGSWVSTGYQITKEQQQKNVFICPICMRNTSYTDYTFCTTGWFLGLMKFCMNKGVKQLSHN